ncbi:MAG: hypothetical protein VX793_12935 [Pseudomonadota bacterium]|nr:hypothetical protein [Pseudomonadota bacterium]
MRRPFIPLTGQPIPENSEAIGRVNVQSPGQTSEQNGVIVDTVRSQRESIYLEMGAKKRQDVIRTLASSVIQVG